jgi:hypothetical protein
MTIGADPAVIRDPHGQRLDRWDELRPSASMLGL